MTGGCRTRAHVRVLLARSCVPYDAASGERSKTVPRGPEDGGDVPVVNAGIGMPVLRKEDSRLLTGRGRFSDEVNLPGQAYAAMVRSPHAHARIAGIDAAQARAAPGVLAVLTGADYLADGLKSIPHRPFSLSPPDIRLANRDGSEIFIAPHFPLPADTARFAGEALAMVVAESVQAAKDAAELVHVDYEPLRSTTEAAAAAQAGAPRVWAERESNVSIDADVGDPAATEAAFARAAHVVRLETRVQRVTGVPMEPRAAVGAYDAAAGRITLHAGSGGVVRQKRELAWILGVEEDAVRVVAHDTGGNFGTRNSFFPEFALIAWAAKRLGRPVKWTCERHEAFLSDYQGRDLTVAAELALDAQGNFLALRCSNLSNAGAHSASHVPLSKGASIMTSVYRIPAAHVRARAVLSNTPPTTPYRSAGRPEVIFVLERLIDLAALHHGFDRVELRRRNLIPESAMPFANPLGLAYDSGAYEKAMSAAHALAFARHRRGELRGGDLGLSDRARGDHRAAGRPHRRSDRNALERPGSRDQLRAAAGRVAGRSFRQRAAGHRRHRRRLGGRRVALGPIDAAREHRHGRGLGSPRRKGKEHRRACPGGGASGYQIQRR